MKMKQIKNIKYFQLLAFWAFIVLIIICGTTLAETVEIDPYVNRLTGTPSTDILKPDETFVTESYVHQRWLPFIQDGRISRKEIISHLGEPTQSYENERILAYRLLLVEADRKIIADYYKKMIAYLEETWQPEVIKRRKILSEKGNLFVFRENMKEERPLENIKWKSWYGGYHQGLFSENIKEERFLELVAREAEYSLVLVFDDNNILSKHSLLRVRP